MKRIQKAAAVSNDSIVYMEVYGMNRVIYQVTACHITKGNTTSAVYGVALKDIRSGETASLPDFSSNLEETIAFANRLISENIPPSGLYDAALGALYQHLLLR